MLYSIILYFILLVFSFLLVCDTQLFEQKIMNKINNDVILIECFIVLFLIFYINKFPNYKYYHTTNEQNNKELHPQAVVF